MEGLVEVAFGVVGVVEGMPEVMLESEVPSEAATISAVRNVSTRAGQGRGEQQRKLKNSKEHKGTERK